ncbi:NAD-dependent epimerase/dehydratase family protein [Pseudoroseicyclus aestuarii]|uniref:UDP-glucose 4-epimerase n=1 Tax=Pseudoroseicyclus aestuarii TaxID=1795041 RepID=A0A318SMZ4_9RHOB|nr:NAD-dependent epimerase/dehydratase family protein [Pseudoroseicyclus aestuarii]PYE82173.1 UDP-glucose 4-epimerase [Pseudoroseicyclus aestuarii]
MSNKTILITGGAGFVGVNLAAHLLQAGGFEVTAFDNEVLGNRAHLPEGTRFISGDLRDRDALAAALEGQEVVVHLAADTRVMDSIENPRFNFENNVIGSFNLLEAARAAGTGRIVAASTGGAILGEVPPPVHEEMVAEPAAPYGASKLAMEGYLSAFAGAYGLTGAALRFSNIYGPRSYHKGSVVAHFYKRILAGEPLTVYGDGSQARDFLFIGDLVRGIEAAIGSDAVGPFQLGSGQPTTVNELLDVMRRVTGRELDVRYEPFRAGELHRTWCDISKAKKTFGFDPDTSLEVGMAETWAWFQERAGA